MRLRAHGFTAPASNHHRNGRGHREQAMQVDYVQSTPLPSPQRQMTFRGYTYRGQIMLRLSPVSIRSPERPVYVVILENYTI